MRKAGILCAVSSLPSKYGIGDFGPNSYEFLKLIKNCGMRYWQILPLNPVGYGNSPYQPYSSFAMDELYLSLDLLKEEGLIGDCCKFNEKSKKVHFDDVRRFKATYYKMAFKHFAKNHDYEIFISNEWVRPYAIFRTLKKHNSEHLWLEWPLAQQKYVVDYRFDLEPYEEEIEYEMFIQYKLYQQWLNLKKTANQLGIEIIGDLPIYVGIDSEDVWSNQECFLLDDKSRPTFIAGVPPDYFSATGQRWGNPLYNWEYLQKTSFKFWVNRLAYNSKLFDCIRIDHFRAFDTYYKIPMSCPTAVEGEWVEAPGYELFDTLFSAIRDLKVIAEDLGDLREEVLVLRDHYHFPGMKILQFEFNPNEKDLNASENKVVYTGTHDNQTIRSWYQSQRPSFKKQTKQFFKNSKYQLMSENFLDLTLADLANTAILPIQDILNLTDRARMNLPGSIGEPNWQWKMSGFEQFKERIPVIKKMIKKHKR